MTDVGVLMDGLVFGEQPRWHDDRLWFSDWGTQEVIAVDMDGKSEVALRGRSFPLCVDWLPDGRLLVVSAREGLLLRQESGRLARDPRRPWQRVHPAGRVTNWSSTAAGTRTSTGAAST